MHRKVDTPRDEFMHTIVQKSARQHCQWDVQLANVSTILGSLSKDRVYLAILNPALRKTNCASYDNAALYI